MSNCIKVVLVAMVGVALIACEVEPAEGLAERASVGRVRRAAAAIAGPTVTVSARGPGELAVSWSADPAAARYLVYQSAGGAAFELEATVFDSSGGSPSTSWIAEGLAGGVRYCYVVQAVYPDGSTSELGAAACSGAGDAGSPTGVVYNVALQPFAMINWFATVQASPTAQAYLQSSGSGGAVIWIPSQPGRSLVAVTLAVKSPSGGFFNAIRVMKFYKDDTAAQQVGFLENLPSAPASWTDVTIPTASTPSDAGYDLALLLDARTADLRAKAIRATYN